MPSPTKQIRYDLMQAMYSPRDGRSHYRLWESFETLAAAKRHAKAAFPNGGYAIQRVETTVMVIKDAADWLAEAG